MVLFHERLAEAMASRSMSQADLCAASGIPKSAINQYLKGRFKPKQTRTYILAETLCVDPAWLMGYTNERGQAAPLSEREEKLIENYRKKPEFRRSVDYLLDETEKTASIFRAAKSHNGRVAPSVEEMTLARLSELENAPETDEDL